MSIIEDRELPNGLKIQVRDLSRRIAENTTKVELEFLIPVPVKEDYVHNEEDLHLLTALFGSEVPFILKKERTFVDNEDQEALCRKLFDDFNDTVLRYIGRPDFPIRFLEAKLADVRKRPHRYRDVLSKLSGKGKIR